MLLFRSHSDSELTRQKGVAMGNKIIGHYSFSTGNLRSRLIQRYQLSSEHQIKKRKKRGRKSISVRIKELKKYLGLKKKKGK